MPAPISFGWTTPALLAGQKTVTRREWKPAMAAQYHAGDVVDAVDRQLRFKGKRIARIELTCDPYRERTNAIPESDWSAEGFEYLTQIRATTDGLTPEQVWRNWHEVPGEVWVVRFRVAEWL